KSFNSAVDVVFKRIDISVYKIYYVSAAYQRCHVYCVIRTFGRIGGMAGIICGVCESSAVAGKVVSFSALYLAVKYRRKTHGYIWMTAYVQKKFFVVIDPIKIAPHFTPQQFFGAKLYRQLPYRRY